MLFCFLPFEVFLSAAGRDQPGCAVRHHALGSGVGREGFPGVVEATEPCYYPEYDPDYYATFEDPDGIRLEVTNFRERRRRHMFHGEASD